MSRKALCIGINYQGTDYELRGCINDADDWAAFLARNQFNPSVLAEAMAKRQSILYALNSLVKGLKPGDTGVVTFSGHGTWLPDITGDEPDRKDEAIVPYDAGENGSNLILDDELRLIFNRIAPGALLVLLTDCCHSGSVFRFFGNGVGKRRPRFLPPSHFIKDVGMFAGMSRAFGRPRARRNAPLPGLIHYSGCKDNEYSFDAEFDGRANGAFTYYAIRAFTNAVAVSASYNDAFKELRSFLPSWDYQQTPQLNATPVLKKQKLFG